MISSIKKFLAGVISVLFAAAVLSAQAETSQMVFPKKIYVGDTAELHYIFRSNVDFFKDNPDKDEMPLNIEKIVTEDGSDSVTVKKAVIQRNGPMYTVVITFVPWKTGRIDFGEFDLLAAVLGTASTIPYLINTNPVEIASVLQKGEDTGLRPAASPLLAPGTIYFIYGAIVLVILLIVLVIVLFAKRHQIALNYRTHQTMRNYARNARKALKQIKKLEKNQEKLTDESFCFAVQQIFRVYLSERYGVNFSTLATGQFMSALNEATAGLLDDDKLLVLEELHSIFVRSDYIRFAHENGLHKGERANLVAKAKEVIVTLEKPVKSEPEPEKADAGPVMGAEPESSGEKKSAPEKTDAEEKTAEGEANA